MKKFKVMQLKTELDAHIVIRTAKGRKIFDMWISGVSITVAAPVVAEIKVEPNLHKTNRRQQG